MNDKARELLSELGVQTLEVGQKLEQFQGIEGGIMDYTDTGIVIIYSVHGMTYEERMALWEGEPRFKIGSFRGVTFLYWKMGVLNWQEANFHYSLAINRTKEIEPLPEGNHYPVTIIGIEANTGEILTLRVTPLPKKQGDLFYRYCMEQKEHPVTQYENQVNIQTMYNLYSINQLMKLVKPM